MLNLFLTLQFRGVSSKEHISYFKDSAAVEESATVLLDVNIDFITGKGGRYEERPFILSVLWQLSCCHKC